MLPPWWFRGFGRRIDLIECFEFRFEIRSCVQVGRVQSSVSEPISDDGRIDARGNQLDSDAVSKRMWADAFFRKRWGILGRCLNILLEFESNTSSAERSTVAIHEDWLIVGTGPAPQQGSEQIHCFRPQGTDSALCAITPAAIGPQYFRETAEVINAAAGGPPDRARMAEIMRRHGLTLAPPQA